MSVNNDDWQSAHSPIAVDLNNSGAPELVGFDADGAWGCPHVEPELLVSGGIDLSAFCDHRDRERGGNAASGNAVDTNVVDPLWVNRAEPHIAYLGFEANSSFRKGDHHRFAADLADGEHHHLIGSEQDGMWNSLANDRDVFAQPKWCSVRGTSTGGGLQNTQEMVADRSGNGG